MLGLVIIRPSCCVIFRRNSLAPSFTFFIPGLFAACAALISFTIFPGIAGAAPAHRCDAAALLADAGAGFEGGHVHRQGRDRCHAGEAVDQHHPECGADHISNRDHHGRLGIRRRRTSPENKPDQQATFHVDKEIPAGAATIKIQYTGILNDQLRGFYLSKGGPSQLRGDAI